MILMAAPAVQLRNWRGTRLERSRECWRREKRTD